MNFEDQTNIAANSSITHAFSIAYDELTKQLSQTYSADRVKFVTLDWAIDSISSGRLLDETAYNPRYLKTNPELRELVVEKSSSSETARNDSEKVAIDKEEEVETPVGEIKPHKISLFLTHHGNQPSGSSHSNHQQQVLAVNEEVQKPMQIETQQSCNNNSNNSNNAFMSPSKSSQPDASGSSQSPMKQHPQKKRPRKQSCNNSISIDDDSSKTGTNSSSTFSFDMNEIFQTVIRYMAWLNLLSVIKILIGSLHW